MSDFRPSPADPVQPYPASLASARRRYLTIVFSDLTGSTRIAGAMEAEDYARLLDHLRQAYQDVIPRFGGTMVQISGDGLLSVFGYPEADEADGRVATQAALELHARVRELDNIDGIDQPLRLHTGIHSGLVLCDEGDSVRGRLELLGSATNIASRLASAAQSDEIVVSEATLGPDRVMFQTSERLYLTLKGKEKPIAAFRVLDRVADDTRYSARERGGLSTFVGREAELRGLAATIERVTAGGTSFVSIVGPPGVGKTRLVGELLRRADTRLRVYRGECDAHLGAEPLQPFLQILRSLLGVARPVAGTNPAETILTSLTALGPALSEHTPVLLHLLATAEGGARKRPPDLASVTAALRTLFERLSDDGPLALFIDDWQWADDASRKVLEGLRALEGAALLVLLTMRSESASEPFDDFDRLALIPFSAEEAQAAVRNVLPGADPFLVGDICTAAGGNPLFIEELCHSVAYGEQDFRTHEGSGWLDILIESRFARLPDAQADLLATAAVIGNVIPAWLLELTTGCNEKDPLLRTLADADFIFPGEREGTFRFKHGITRDVIYDSVGLRQRRSLHLRIAEALRQKGAAEGEEDLYEALAYHYGAGGDAATTAHYSELAGDKAMARSSLDRAQQQYRAALDALDRLPQAPETAHRWHRIARRFGLAGVWDPSPHQLPVFELAVERARAQGDGAALALAEYWLGYIHYGLGLQREAINHSERALEAALLIGNESIEVQIRALLGQACGDHERALTLLDEAIAAMRRLIAGGNDYFFVGYAYTLSCRAFVLADMGSFTDARIGFEEALKAAGSTGHAVEASILSQYGVACIWQGALDDARRIAADSKRVSERVRTFYLYAKSVSKDAYIRWLETGSTVPIQELLEATAWLDESNRQQWMSLNYGWLAEMMAAQDRGPEARHWAARALAQARKGDRLGEAMALRAVARLEAAHNRRERADFYLARSLAAARGRKSKHDIAATHLRAAEIALFVGDRPAALARLDQAEAGFAEMNMPWHREQAAKLRAAAGTG